MKIHNNDQIVQNLYPETNNKTKSSADIKFGTILKETVENSQKADSGPRQTAFINPLSGIQLTLSPLPDKQFTIKRIENLIDLLDQYRQKLTDPRMTLKKIDPIIQEMSEEKETLAPVLDSLPDGEGLKNILNQTLVTASLEITKFYRGDYITA